MSLTVSTCFLCLAWASDSIFEVDCQILNLQLSLNPGNEPDGQELPQTASSASRSARSTLASGRQNSLMSPHATADAVLRSYNLRVHSCRLHAELAIIELTDAFGISRCHC